jgi:ATP-dependent protease HslVU (ClpYQ) peptidase subunit
MTCIVGLKEDGAVYLAADTQCTGGNVKSDFKSKLARNGELIIGAAGSVVIGDLIKYVFRAPKRGSTDAYQYLIGEYAPALRTFLKSHEVTNVKDGRTWANFEVVVALDSRLFTVGAYFDVLEYDSYAAKGSGKEVALGALHATDCIEPVARVTMAVQAAIKHADGCGGEVKIMSTKDAT